MQITESFVLAQRTFTETLIGLGAATFEGIKRLVELNVQAARDTVTEAGQVPQVMLTITNPQNLMTRQFSLVESRVQRMGVYGFRLQEIAISAGSEISEVVRAGASQIQSTVLTMGEIRAQSAVVDAPQADGQVDAQADRQADGQSHGQAIEQANGHSNGHADKQATLDAPSIHNTSNRTKKLVPRTRSAGTNDPATNKNGGGGARNGSEKSLKRSADSGSGSDSGHSQAS